MSESQEEFPDAQPVGGASYLSRLRHFNSKLASMPALQPIRAFVQRARLVTRPADRLSLRIMPASLFYRGEEVITVLSANLWHDWPRHRRLVERLEVFARLVEAEGIDVLLLQEVARTPDVHADRWLAERLGMSYVYSRANGHHKGIGFEEGLAVFSRFPLGKIRLRQLKPNFEPFARRLVLGAELKTPKGMLPVFSVHLSLLPSQNAAQVSHLQSWVTDIAGERPALIGGDFNTPEHASQIAQIKRTWLDVFRYLNPGADGTTHEFRLPWGRKPSRRRLDYIFLHPGKVRWKLLDARHLDVPDDPYSDHRAVLVKFKLDG